MPKTARRKNRPYRRRRRKKKYFVTPRKSPVPLRFPTKLRYTGQLSLNPGAGSASSVVIHGNSCYDPIVAAGGHQPRGFDEIMALYDHFVVIGSKINVTFQPTSSTVNMYGGIALRDAGTALTVFNDYMEGGNVVSRALNNQTGGSFTSLSYASSPRKFLGRTKVLADPDLKGSAAANPAEGYFYHIFAAASDGASDPQQIDIVFTIDYSVIFIEPKVPTQS